MTVQVWLEKLLHNFTFLDLVDPDKLTSQNYTIRMLLNITMQNQLQIIKLISNK